jgi:hypothetical protein
VSDALRKLPQLFRQESRRRVKEAKFYYAFERLTNLRDFCVLDSVPAASLGAAIHCNLSCHSINIHRVLEHHGMLGVMIQETSCMSSHWKSFLVRQNLLEALRQLKSQPRQTTIPRLAASHTDGMVHITIEYAQLM